MSPWYASFSGGTRISAGLAAARKALIRDHVRARIVLISDLGDASDDLSRMKRELVGLEHAGIELRVMPGCGDRRPGGARGRRRPARDHACRERALRRLPALAGGGMSLLMKSAALAALLAAAVVLAVAAHSDHRVAALGCLGGGVVVRAAGRADTGRRSALSLRDRALAKLDELTRIGSTAERSPQGPASRARSPPWSPSLLLAAATARPAVRTSGVAQLRPEAQAYFLMTSRDRCSPDAAPVARRGSRAPWRPRTRSEAGSPTSRRVWHR
jgi:hypothetical protein